MKKRILALATSLCMVLTIAGPLFTSEGADPVQDSISYTITVNLDGAPHAGQELLLMTPRSYEGENKDHYAMPTLDAAGTATIDNWPTGVPFTIISSLGSTSAYDMCPAKTPVDGEKLTIDLYTVTLNGGPVAALPIAAGINLNQVEGLLDLTATQYFAGWKTGPLTTDADFITGTSVGTAYAVYEPFSISAITLNGKNVNQASPIVMERAARFVMLMDHTITIDRTDLTKIAMTYTADPTAVVELDGKTIRSGDLVDLSRKTASLQVTSAGNTQSYIIQIGYDLSPPDNSGTGTGGNYDYDDNSPAPITGYYITATAGEGGSIAASGKVKVQVGGEASFTVTPDKGYQLAEVQVDGKSVGNEKNTYTFTNVRSDHTIHVTFIKEAHENPKTGVSEK